MKTKTKKRTWRWVTRGCYWNVVNIWHDKINPAWKTSELDLGQINGKNIEMHIVDFKSLFGFTPRKGECFKMEFSGKKIK